MDPQAIADRARVKRHFEFAPFYMTAPNHSAQTSTLAIHPDSRPVPHPGQSVSGGVTYKSPMYLKVVQERKSARMEDTRSSQKQQALKQFKAQLKSELETYKMQKAGLKPPPVLSIENQPFARLEPDAFFQAAFDHSREFRSLPSSTYFNAASEL